MNRVISKILIVLFIVQITAFTGVDASLDEDVQNSLEKEILVKLGILKDYIDSTQWDQDFLTRGEMVAIAIRLLGLEDVVNENAEDEYFKDVIPGSLYAEYINLAYSMGIVSGVSATEFQPKGTISYPQMIKILIHVLGYDIQAEYAGGYPAGYLSVASQIGLLKGIKTLSGDVIRADAFKIIHNALEIDLMTIVRANDRNTYTVVKGKNILTEYLKIEIVEGIVYANHYTGLYDEDGKVPKNHIKIEDKVYLAKQDNAASFLGFNVKAYIKKDDQEDYVLFMVQKSNNHSYAVEASLISENTDKSTLCYYEDLEATKERKISLGENASVIYNETYLGRLYTERVTVNDLIPETGNLYLIDNNGDEVIDVIFITSYQTYVVDNVSIYEPKIYDKNYQPPLDLSNISESKLSIMSTDKSVLRLSDLKQWDVLAVAKPKKLSSQVEDDMDLMNIIVVRKKVIGIVEAVDDDAVVIDGVSYYISDYFKQSGYDIKIGYKGNFYFDIENKLTACDYGGSTDSYGYLVKAIQKDGVSNLVQMKIYTQDGEMKVFDCAEKVVYNQDTKISSTELLNHITQNGETMNQLITYSLNKDGEIAYFNTALPNRDFNKFSLGYQTPPGSTTRYIVNKFFSRYVLSTETKIFSIPDDKSKENEYAILPRSAIAGDESYVVSLYDIDEYNYIGAAVINVGEEISQTDKVVVVERVVKGFGESGEYYKIIGMYNNNPVELLVADGEDIVNSAGDKGQWGYVGTTVSQLKFGDVIQVSRNPAGKVTKFRLLFRYSENQPYHYKTGSATLEALETIPHVALVTAYNEVIRRNDQVAIIDNLYEKTINFKGDRFTLSVYICDLENKKIIVGTYQDIAVGDKVLLTYDWSSTKELIVYK